jgi:hypothetical protein
MDSKLFGSSRAAPSVRGSKVYTCSLFSKNAKVTEEELVEDPSATVCVHVYRNSQKQEL